MPLLSSVKVQRLERVLVFLQSLLKYAWSILFLFSCCFTFFPWCSFYYFKKKACGLMKYNMLEGGEVLTVYFRYCVREARCRCLCWTLNQTSSRSFMRREAAAFWLCHLPHQHHFQAPAMHLSVAEGVQGEQAHEGHGAAPALLAVTKRAGNVLCAGDQEHPAQPQG